MNHAARHYKTTVTVWSPSADSSVFGQSYDRVGVFQVELVEGGSLSVDEAGNEFTPKKTLFGAEKISVGAKIAVGESNQSQPPDTAELVRSVQGAQQLKGHWEWITRTG